MTKINRDGGPMYRLIAVQESTFIDQEQLDGFKLLKICIATKFGLVGSPYTLVPKKYSVQKHNIIKGFHNDFKSMFEFIKHYTFTKVQKLSEFNSLQKNLEVEVKIISLNKIWSGEALLVFIPSYQETPDLTPPSCVPNYITGGLEDSIRNLFSTNGTVFRSKIKEMCQIYNDVVTHERDIYALDHFLRYFGFELQHRRVGIDSPKAKLIFLIGKKSKTIPYPIELKTHSKKFFSDASRKYGKGKEKYFSYVPLVVLCLKHNAQKIWKRESGIGVISIEELLKFSSKIAGLRLRIIEAHAA